MVGEDYLVKPQELFLGPTLQNLGSLMGSRVECSFGGFRDFKHSLVDRGLRENLGSFQ